MFGFIGPNGCGKTTAIRHVLGLYTPDQGRVRVFGRDPVRNMRHIGMDLAIMLDQPALCNELTAQEYLEVFCGLYRIGPVKTKGRVEEVLQMIGLTEQRNRRLDAFSKGMRQRVAFGRCVLGSPRLLLLDEPFDGIDNETRRNLLELLPKIVRECGATALVTSHNLADIDRASDRVALVNHGRIIALDSPRALREQCLATRNITVTITIAPGVDAHSVAQIVPDASYDPRTREIKFDAAHKGVRDNAVVKRLAEAGIPVTGMETTDPSLEDVYFALIKEDDSKCRE